MGYIIKIFFNPEYLKPTNGRDIIDYLYLLSGNGRTSPVFQTSNADTGKQENIAVAIKNVATY